MTASVVWGDCVLDAGFSQIPNALLDHQHDIGLTNDELCLVVHVLRYKYSESDPYPRNATIAERMQCSERTLERYIHSLKEKGLLVREQVNDWKYTWNFSLLLKRLHELSGGGVNSVTGGASKLSPGGGVNSVTQNNTSIKNNTREEEEQRAREGNGLTLYEQHQRQYPRSGQMTGPTQDHLESLLQEREVPPPRRQQIATMMENGIQQRMASKLIDEIKVLPRRKVDDGMVTAKLFNGSLSISCPPLPRPRLRYRSVPERRLTPALTPVVVAVVPFSFYRR